MRHVLFPLLCLVGCASSPQAGSDTDASLGTEVDDTDSAVSSPSTPADEPSEPATFTAHLIGSPSGPAFVTVGDVDGDGQLDIVLSSFGKPGALGIDGGTVTVWKRTGDLTEWSREVVVAAAEDVEFPNHTTLRDVDGDGDLDVWVPSGFLVCAAIPWEGSCGALAWYEQTPSGWTRHGLVENNPLFFHSAQFADLDGDGREDLVTVAETFGSFGPVDAQAMWLKGVDGGDYFDPQPHTIGQGMGGFPTLIDLDGDGDLDIASAEYAMAGSSAAWFEQTAAPSPEAPDGQWTRHEIAADLGPSIQLSLVPDLYGDGATRAVLSNHSNTQLGDPWESGIYALDIPDDPRGLWPHALISEGIVSVEGSPVAPQAAPGIFGEGDMDGDGDIDLVVSGDGDPRVFWLEQTAPGDFSTHVLHPNLTQAGGMVIVDLDGDGQNEAIVTGYDDDALYVVVRDPTGR